MAERKKRKRGPNLSVGRGEKLPASKGAGLTAKGRAKYNRETGSNLKPPVTGKPKTKEEAEALLRHIGLPLMKPEKTEEEATA